MAVYVAFAIVLLTFGSIVVHSAFRFVRTRRFIDLGVAIGAAMAGDSLLILMAARMFQ